MSDKTLYGGWPLNYYRGAIDSAIDEIDRIEQAMGVQASRIRTRFEQVERLISALEQEDKDDE